MKSLVILLILLFFISCNKYRGYRGFGLKHDVGEIPKKQQGTFFYTPLPKDSTIKQ